MPESTRTPFADGREDVPLAVLRRPFAPPHGPLACPEGGRTRRRPYSPTVLALARSEGTLLPRRRRFHFAPWALVLAALPGLLFAVVLVVASRLDPRFSWVATPTRAPWQVWLIALAGGIGLVGTMGDFVYHRHGPRPVVGAPEHRAHVIALLTGGLPLFVVMACATFSARPTVWLVPVFVLALWTLWWIAYDELVFHRRRACSRFESALHRMATLGNGVAFLAWVGWVFEAGVR